MRKNNYFNFFFFYLFSPSLVGKKLNFNFFLKINLLIRLSIDHKGLTWLINYLKFLNQNRAALKTVGSQPVTNGCFGHSIQVFFKEQNN